MMIPDRVGSRRYIAAQIASGLVLAAAVALTIVTVNGRTACLIAIYVEFVVISTIGDLIGATSAQTWRTAMHRMILNMALGIPACALAAQFID